MTGRLDGLRMLVVGGGSGIGRAVALGYRDEGAHVTVIERSKAFADELEAEGGLAIVTGDATDPDVLREGVGRAAETRGLDNLTCCVGVFDHYASVRDLSPNDLRAAGEEIWRVNVLSTLAAVAAAWPALRGGGSVTLTLSESAFHPVGGGVLYGSSKWALRGVVQHLAVDLAPTVRVNGVAPGGTSGTRFSGLSSLGEADRSVGDREGRDERIAAGTLLALTPTPADHVGAYVYLADPVAAHVVTGHVINTDGGRALH